MIRIAVVDDEMAAIDMIVSRVLNIQKNFDVEFQIDTYTEVEKLLNTLQAISYQALFLDLDMPEKSGFDISSVLRESGNEVPIIYITNRDDLMQQAFQYKVLGFVRKNNLEEELPLAVSCVLREIQKNSKKITVVSAQKQKKSRYELNISDIMYIESENHQTKIHLKNAAEIISTRETLNSYILQNGFKDFIQISSSCIVNYMHIFSIEKDTVILNNDEVLYISRRKTRTVKEQFLQLSRRPLI